MALRYVSGVTKTLDGTTQKLAAASIPGVVSLVLQNPSTNSNIICVESHTLSMNTANGVSIGTGKEWVLSPPERAGDTETFDLSDFSVKGTNTETLKFSYWQRF